MSLARIAERPVALVADEDDRVIHTVDAQSLEELAVTELPGVGTALLVRRGRAFVALRNRSQVAVFESRTDDAKKPLTLVATVSVPTEPVGLASTSDDSKLLVTSGWGHALSVVDMATLEVERVVDLAREPRGVVASSDGHKAYVTHVVGGVLSVVDLTGASATKSLSTHQPRGPAQPISNLPKAVLGAKAKGAPGGLAPPRPVVAETPRRGCQGFALAKSVGENPRIFAPQTLVETGNVEVRTGGYGTGSFAAEVGNVAVVDEGRDEIVSGSTKPGNMEHAHARTDCLLPRAAVFVPKINALLVTCLGQDSVVEYDAVQVDPHGLVRRQWNVSGGPVGIGVDERGERAFVWSQFDRVLSVISLDEHPPPAADEEATEAKGGASILRVALSRKPEPPAAVDLALGRKLFHASGDRRLASDGRACASCHPDGRDDALTWATPEGPRQTPMLAGRLEGTGPFGWLGNGVTVEAHLHQTFSRLRGSGLRGNDLEALVGYLAAMRKPAHASTTELGAQVVRGKELFFSEATACSSCHVGDGTTDGATHSVAAKTEADQTDQFNTPSLRFVGGTAPYFHDGRYATLRDLLAAPDHTMGNAQALPSEDRDALEAYLRTL